MLAVVWERAWKYALYQPKQGKRPTQIQGMETQTLLFNEKSHKVILQRVWIQGKVKNICNWSTTILFGSSEPNNHAHTHARAHTHTFSPFFILLVTNANWEDSIFSLTTSCRLQLPYFILRLYLLEYRYWQTWIFLLFKMPGLCDLHQTVVKPQASPHIPVFF